MSARRVKNLLTGDWVIVSPEGRLNRPWKGALEDEAQRLAAQRSADPLAPGAQRGNGQLVPAYEFTYLFRNDFPVFDPVDEVGGAADGPEHQLFVSRPCQGENHVMVYSPDFNQHFAQMNSVELGKVFEGWRDFFSANKSRFEYIQIFENRGQEVGSSLPHPHCQIWSTKFLPTNIQKAFHSQKARSRPCSTRFQEYFEKNKSPLLVDYLNEELRRSTRIVAELEHFVVLVPYWAYWPFETMIIARHAVQRIDELTEEEGRDFMRALQVAVGKYDAMFGCAAPYVLGVRNAPVGPFLAQDLGFWQLHVNIFPPLLVRGRKKFMAGYELLAEVQRDFSAEQAAARLREVRYEPTNG